MDYAKIQARLYRGYGSAAKRIGQKFHVYRAAGMDDPISGANRLVDSNGDPVVVKASLTTVMDWSHYNKPAKPDWFCLVDATDLKIGDWLVCVEGGETDSGTVFIADLQPLLPIPVIQTNTVVDFVRVGYSDVSGGFQPEEAAYARNVPVFLKDKKDKSKTPAGFPDPTMIEQHIPEWEFRVNARAFDSIKKGDVIIDANGRRFEVSVPVFSSFGYTVLARELPLEPSK